MSIEIVDNPDRLIKLLINTGKRIVFRPVKVRMLSSRNNLQMFVQSCFRRGV